MNPAATKALIDIEKRTFDQLFGRICLEENRNEQNIKNCTATIDSMIQLLKRCKSEIKHGEAYA